MTRWLSLAVVVLALGVASSVFGQQDDAHMGTWKQNFDKSKSTPPPTGARPQSITRVYEPFEGKGIKATFTTVSADGKKTVTTYSAHFDGKDYAFTGGQFTSIALKKVDRYTWETTTRNKGNKAIVTGTNVVSKDGKTMTYSFKGTNAQGEPISGASVFEKQ